MSSGQTVSVKKDVKRMFSCVLPNGIRVVGECMPGYRSVSMGVWINAGSVYELGGESGAAHFIEHMLFKGTKTRSASRIAEEMDAIGGNLNAFTSKECTCFYGRVLGRDIEALSDVLADLIENSLLDPDDIGREKGVVSEEIRMIEDTPEDLVMDTAISLFYEGDPLERPILGTLESVGGFTREGLVRYMNRLYTPDNMVIAAAGDFDPERLIDVLGRSFRLEGGAPPDETGFGFHAPGLRTRFIKKDIEQAHIALCLPGFRKDTRESYALLLLSNCFGGSMSSRLFQKIREEMGLAYSVYSYPTAYRESGFLTLYAGTGAQSAAKVTELLYEEMARVREHGVTEEELARAKEQLISSFLMAQESTSARASAIGRTELLRGRHLTEDELTARIRGVDIAEVNGILDRVFDPGDVSACVVGRIGESRREIEKLICG